MLRSRVILCRILDTKKNAAIQPSTRSNLVIRSSLISQGQSQMVYCYHRIHLSMICLIATQYSARLLKVARMASLFCIAHRGGPMHNAHTSPENSLEAIRRRLELRVDAIEIAIWQIEGELIVPHDRRLGRQLKGRGLLLQKPLAEVRQLTLENGEPVPTLHQVLELVGDRALLNIEIK